MKKKCNFYSVYDNNTAGKEDKFHFNYCRKRGWTFVTLDNDFMDDKKYPFTSIPGIIIISAGKYNRVKIGQCINRLLNFLSFFPLPKSFVGDTKFLVSPHACTIRGKDAKTRQLKTMKIVPGDTVTKVREEFNYF